MNSRAEHFIAELTSLAKHLCPEAEVRISTASLEGEDANMDILVPPEAYDKANEVLVHRSWEILVDEGYDIVVGVYDREELAARMAVAA